MTAGRPQILVLAHRFPYPPNRGDRVRTYHLLRFLSERANVDLATLADEPTPPEHHNELAKLCRRLAVRPLGKGRWFRAARKVLAGRSASEGLFLSDPLRDDIRKWTELTSYDAAVVVCSGMAPYLNDFVQVPKTILVDLVDVDSQKWLDYAATSRQPMRALFCLEGKRLRQLEYALTKRVDAVSLVSEPEATLFRAVCPNDRTWAIANGVDLDYFAPRAVEEVNESLAFIGALDYRANVMGIRWFVKNVWPQLLDVAPQATLRIVGRNPVPEVRQLIQHPGIEVHGDVADVRPYLGEAALAIAPLQVARGIQNKVLEAMAMSKVVVASPQALEGIDARDGVHVCAADQPWQWVEQIRRLWRHPELRTRIGGAGRRFVEESHSWSARLKPLQQLLDLCLPYEGGDRQNSSRLEQV